MFKKKKNQTMLKGKTIVYMRRTLVIMAVFLITIYFILKLIYDAGKFTVILDSAGYPQSSLIIYEHYEEKKARQKLYAEEMEFFTNISVDWIPENIGDEAEGPHNGNNYIAYTFYIENVSNDTINYWYKIVLDDVIKNVDEALRVMIILNDEKTIYAKENSTTKEPEKDTTKFYSEEKVAVTCREKFASGEVDKCTIVIWLEGDDPDCTDDLIGGEIKMHMDIIEEHIAQE